LATGKLLWADEEICDKKYLTRSGGWGKKEIDGE
jgi:hypothetical protein